MDQLDLIRNSDPELAKAYRTAAETAMFNPYFTDQQKKERSAYYLELAKRHEPSAP